MKKITKSYRMDENRIYDLKIIANKFNCNMTQALEMCIDYFIKTGACYSINDYRMTVKGSQDIRTTERILYDALSDGEVMITLRNKIMHD